MAYKIQGLDSDSFVSAKQKSQSKNSNGSQQGGKQHAGALMGVLSSNLDELQLNLETPHQGDDVNLAKGKGHISSETLQDILAEISALTNKLQELESKFQDDKNGMDTKIGKAAINAAQTAAKTLQTNLAEAAKNKTEMKWLGVLGDVVEGVMFAVAVVTGQFEIATAMVVLFAAQESGGTAAFTKALSTGLHDLGMSKAAAKILASVITIVAEVAVTLFLAGGASLATGALQGAKEASAAAVEDVVETAVQTSVKDAVSTAVKTALKDGVEMGSKEMETVVESAAKEAAENTATEMADSGLGSRLVNKSVEKGIKKGIEKGILEGAEENSQGRINSFVRNTVGDESGETAANNAVKKLAKTLAKKLAKEVAEKIGQVAAKSVEDLPEDLQATLKASAQKIAFKRLGSALAITSTGAASNSGFIENVALSLSTLFPKKDQHGIQILMEVLLSLLAMAATIEAATSTSGESNVNNVLEDGTSAAEQSGNKVARMLKGIMSKMISNPARMMSYAQTGAGFGDAAAQVAMAAAEIKMSKIENAMSESKPEMQENNSIAQIQNQIAQADRKLFDQLYRAIPTIMADANSIGAIFASAAQAISS